MFSSLLLDGSGYLLVDNDCSFRRAPVRPCASTFLFWFLGLSLGTCFFYELLRDIEKDDSFSSLSADILWFRSDPRMRLSSLSTSIWLRWFSRFIKAIIFDISALSGEPARQLLSTRFPYELEVSSVGFFTESPFFIADNVSLDIWTSLSISAAYCVLFRFLLASESKERFKSTSSTIANFTS